MTSILFDSDSRPGPRRRPPNVVVILCDDLGNNCLGIMGNRLVRTPNMDRIARDGARLVDCYAGDAVCAPSRAALLTGRQPQRSGFEFLPVSPVAIPKADDMSEDERRAYAGKMRDTLARNGLSQDEITLAEHLKRHGYSTALFGKWHLGESEQANPTRRGFDEFVGILGGAALHADPDDPDIVSFPLPWSKNDAALWRLLRHEVVRGTARPEKADAYLSDLVAAEAVRFIHEHRSDPFFLTLGFQEPHMPLQAPRFFYHRLAHVTDEKARVFYAMIEALDASIGRVLDALTAEGLDRETIVVFTSDNGGSPWPRIPEQNFPYRGWKFTYFEGGLNVPMFVRWTGTIAPGTIVPGVASHLDIFPTVAAAAGIALPDDRDYDGIDLLPALTGHSVATVAIRELVWRKGPYWCIRRGHHKLQVSESPEKVWLFDLERDPTERFNLAAHDTATVAELREALARQVERFVEPAWPSTHRARIDIDGTAPDPSNEVEHVDWFD